MFKKLLGILLIPTAALANQTYGTVVQVQQVAQPVSVPVQQCVNHPSLPGAIIGSIIGAQISQGGAIIGAIAGSNYGSGTTCSIVYHTSYNISYDAYVVANGFTYVVRVPVPVSIGSQVPIR
jgi:hypothetical protein